MYNTDLPTRAELPTTRQLLRSTAIAAATAAALLATVVLPSEYAIDPTGIGRLLGLLHMGEIKQQLAREAAADRARDAAPTPSVPVTPERRSSLLGRVFAGLLIGPAHAQDAGEIAVVLAPGEGSEVKMAMKAGAKANYTWSATGNAVNYDLHGTAPGGKESSYKKGRGVSGDSGVLIAGYDGHHGWFWRNRGAAPVTVTLKVSGDFSDLKKMK